MVACRWLGRLGRRRSDASQTKQRRREYSELQDKLTGLPNRAGLAGPLDKAFDRADSKGMPLCLLYLGIDSFREVNEAYGHEVGDRLLCALAGRLKAVVPQDALLTRVAGDEFLVVMPGDAHVARQLSSELLSELSRPDSVGGVELTITCSLGIAWYPQHGQRQDMLGRALTAMRAAKLLGGGAHAEYDLRMGLDQREASELARDLRVAVEQQQFELVYQPKIDAKSLQITAAEALLRWHHPTRGVVSPALFIPIAERHRLIGDIGNWVIEEAARQAAAWRDMGLRMRVAVNVSAFQMRQDDFTDRLRAALKKNQLKPARFTVEVTETMAMEDTAVTREAFERLRALGVHVSIDDFGTGHSSLAVLRRLPAAELKIDRAFVSDLDQGAEAQTIATTIVQMAHTLGLRVVAEGVETVRQRDLLVAMGCDELQGYLFARPMSARALTLWALDEQSRDGEAFRPSLFRETVRTVWAEPKSVLRPLRQKVPH